MSGQTGADISARAESSADYRHIGFVFSNREPGHQSGVYLVVLEQSILPNRTGRTWSFTASLGVQGIIVALLLVLPLIYSDRIGDLHRTSFAIGAPVRQGAPKPIENRVVHHQAGRGHARRLLVWPPIAVSREPRKEDVEEDAAIDPPAIPGFIGDGSKGRNLAPMIDIATPIPPPAAKPAAPSPKPQAPIRVGGDVQAAKLVRKVLPLYPALARSARIGGIVHLLGVISRDGTIRNLQVMDGHPLLVQAALDAVRQWVYAPTLLNGEAVEVMAPIEVRFTLSP
jgi:protein TonB